jgi:hypothetical protein
MGTTEQFTPLYQKKILPEFGKGPSILRSLGLDKLLDKDNYKQKLCTHLQVEGYFECACCIRIKQFQQVEPTYSKADTKSLSLVSNIQQETNHKITSRVLSALLKTIQEETSAWVTPLALPSNLLFGMQMYIIL